MRAGEFMSPPEKPPKESLSDAEIDELYGLEPVIGQSSDNAPSTDSSPTAEFVTVDCPYCGEAFDSQADASAGSCFYVEDCQICCQPIEMQLHVNEDGTLRELIARRGDS
jgi:hypothetical protein